MTELTRAVATRQTINPKTVLGFYATILGLVLAACSALVAALTISKVSVWLVPWILGFTGLLTVLLITAVLVINVKAPAKLMLGQVSGEEYALITQVTLGDSLNGQHLARSEDRESEGRAIFAVTEPSEGTLRMIDADNGELPTDNPQEPSK